MRLIKFVPDDTNIHFLRFRVPFYAISTLLVIASWVFVLTPGIQYGVDFSAGQQFAVTFTRDDTAPISAVRQRIDELGYGEPVVQQSGAQNQASIRLRLPPAAEGNAAISSRMTDQIGNAITTGFPGARIDDATAVSSKVSKDLKRDAKIALLCAMIAIAIYIWVRFEWQFGVGALVALVHDVSLTLGMFALFQMEFNLNIIAAILTIIGYSLNDTIVVYDRIRENLKKYRRMPIVELLDLSVNETLARTVMTSMTLLVVLLSLLFLGPQSLFGFTAAITLGIFVGTYSSIYMAAPILVWLGVSGDSFVPGEDAGARQQAKIARGEA